MQDISDKKGTKNHWLGTPFRSPFSLKKSQGGRQFLLQWVKVEMKHPKHFCCSWIYPNRAGKFNTKLTARRWLTPLHALRGMPASLHNSFRHTVYETGTVHLTKQHWFEQEICPVILIVPVAEADISIPSPGTHRYLTCCHCSPGSWEARWGDSTCTGSKSLPEAASLPRHGSAFPFSFVTVQLHSQWLCFLWEQPRLLLTTQLAHINQVE